MYIGMSDWVVYILQCSDNTLYTGITTDVDRRLHEHNSTGRSAKYTRSRRPVELVYQLACHTRSEAARAEYQIRKLGKAKKLALVANYQFSIN